MDPGDSRVAQSKLIAALDALVLNDQGCKSTYDKKRAVDNTEEEVEIVAVGPVPIKPKAASSKGTRKGKSSVQGSTCNVHPFFLAAGVTDKLLAPSSSVSSSSKTRTRTMEQVPTLTNELGDAFALSPISDTGSKSHPVSDNNVKATKGKQRTQNTNATLPMYSYKDYTPKPTVVYTRHEEEANDLVAALENGPLGFDLEWRVLWARRANAQNATPCERRTAIVQLADTTGLILVIQIYGMSRFPKKLQELIEDPNVPKLGVNILNDGNKLLNDYGILAKNLVELGALVHLADPAGGHALTGTRTNLKYKDIISLAKLVERYCQKTLDKAKAQRMGNWEMELDKLQIDYAANDAHCALKIYDRLLDLAQLNGMELNEDLIKERCSSSVSSPHPKRTDQALSKATSCPDIPKRSRSRSLQQHETMPNLFSTQADRTGPASMRPQQLRAYQFWYERGMSLERMCVELSLKAKRYTGQGSQNTASEVARSSGIETAFSGDDKENRASDALKPSTVISYVIGALEADMKLPFDMEKLRELVQMDAGSWERHRDWIFRAWGDGRY